MQPDAPISEEFRLVAKKWAEADAAASLLEETKSAVLSQYMIAHGDGPVNRAEMTVKASKEWREFVESMVKARERANRLKVQMEWIRMKFHEWQSKEASRRAEMKL